MPPILHLGNPFVKNVIGQYVTRGAVQQPSRTKTNRIVVHHAAWIYPPGGAVQSIFSYHSSKWPQYGRIGYHEVIQVEADGSLVCYEVNPTELIGAGVWGQNGDCFHICAATDFKNEIPLQIWQDALALRVAEARRRYPQAAIVGHKEITLPGHGTECPGGRWAEWKPALIANAENLSKRYRVRGVAIHQGPALSFPIALDGEAFLSSNEEIEIDAVKVGGWGHLKDGRGFVLLEQLRRL